MNVHLRLGLGKVAFAGAALAAIFAFQYGDRVRAAAGGPVEKDTATYRVLPPIESGNLLLFPVVRESKADGGSPFLTLDEGLKSGQVEITEAGKVRGLVRPRSSPQTPDGGIFRPYPEPPHVESRGDQVNTLVLVNNSDRPLLLLAGEIVTGGKQDRVIAKDRIVPAGSEPINLGVFCIEPGRWTEDTATFGASAKAPSHSLMVQPSVREKAMASKDQHEVWNSVNGTIDQMAAVTAPLVRRESHGTARLPAQDPTLAPRVTPAQCKTPASAQRWTKQPRR